MYGILIEIKMVESSVRGREERGKSRGGILFERCGGRRDEEGQDEDEGHEDQIYIRGDDKMIATSRTTPVTEEPLQWSSRARLFFLLSTPIDWNPRGALCLYFTMRSSEKQLYG